MMVIVENISGKKNQGVRVLCILPIAKDSRIARRVDMLKDAGFEVEAAAFYRDKDVGRIPDCRVEYLGHLRHGHYASRIPRLLATVPRVRRAIARNDIVYVFNCDIAMLALVSAVGLHRPMVIETADIRDLQVARNWKGRIVRAMDKLATEFSNLLVLTSEDYQEYYRDWLGIDKKRLVIENKLSADFATSIVPEDFPKQEWNGQEEAPLRIGWFGMLRDEWSWQVLDRLTLSDPQRFSGILAGVLQRNDVERALAHNPGLTYLGEYSYPDGLRDLYCGVDLTLAVKPPQIPTSWSKLNRFYETCLFRRPAIVRAGCADARLVTQYDIGLVIESTDVDEAVAEIRSIRASDMNRWRTNMALLPASAYAVTDEAVVLGKAIADVVGPITKLGGVDGA